MSAIVTAVTWIFLTIFIFIIFYLLWVGLVKEIVETIKKANDKKKRFYCKRCGIELEEEWYGGFCSACESKIGEVAINV